MTFVRTGDGYLNLHYLIRAQRIDPARSAGPAVLRVTHEAGEVFDLADPEAGVLLRILEDLALPRPVDLEDDEASGRPPQSQDGGAGLARGAAPE